MFRGRQLRPRNITFSTSYKPKPKSKRPEFAGLLSADFPESLDDLLESVDEAAGLAEAMITQRTRRRPFMVEVFASVRPSRRVAKFIIPTRRSGGPLSPRNLRWLSNARYRGDENPLYSFHAEFLMLKKSSMEALVSDPNPLPTRLPETTSLLLSDVVSRPSSRMPFAKTVGLPQTDMWQRLRERKRVGIMPR